MSAAARAWPLLLAALGGGLGAASCSQQLQVLEVPAEADAAVPAEIAVGDCSSCPSGSFCRDGQCVLPSSIETLAAGSRHTCMVRRGQLLCWGSNQSNQLGTGDGAPYDLPTPVGRDSDWYDVAAGGRHSCGLRAPGRLYCWGDNSNGQIGDGSTRGRSSPRAISSVQDFVAISAGGDNSCAIRRGGALFCWGDGSAGRSGVQRGGDQAITAPSVVAPQDRFDQVAVGADHSCAIRSDGALFCWGRNADGELGLGADRAEHDEPIQVGSDLGWSQVAVGGEHTCGIRARRLLCWGGNDYAQVGVGREGPDGVRLRVDRPVALDSASDWLAVATGDFHACAYKSAPGLFCWGSASEGQLGAGMKEVSDTPTRVPLLEDVRHLALGAAHSCALDVTHKLYCWGDNAQGQLGLDDTSERDQPVQLNLML